MNHTAVFKSPPPPKTCICAPARPALAATASTPTASSPERLTVESQGTFGVKLGPELSFAQVISFKPGEVSAEIEYRQVYPVIQSYGAGEAQASWEFKAHAAHPLLGTQFVYAVVAVMPEAEGGRGYLELSVTSQKPVWPDQILFAARGQGKRHL